MAIGDLFKKAAGISPSEFRDLLSLEREAQKVLGKELVIKPFESDLVPKRGNIFEVAPYSSDLEKDFDDATDRIGKVCRP